MGIKTFQINEKGSALVVALFFVAILTVIGLALLFNTSLDNVISNNYSKTVRATYTATSGIERFKAYLLYDYKHDPAGWANQYLVVPQGTTYADGTLAPPASAIGGSGSDAYLDMDFVGNTVTIPNTTPYKINPNIRYAVDPAMYAEIAASPGNPISPGSGYQLMLRNVAGTKGAACSSASDCDANSIFVLAIGRTTTTKAYLGATSQGMNVIEEGIFGDDISVWNNIFFAEDNALSGGGAMTIHGNIHTLGPNPPPNSGTVTFDTKADVLNSYYYSNANKSLKDPLKSTLSLPQQRNPANILDPVNSLHAKVRVRNGLIDISQGGAHIGEPTGTGIPFDQIATCQNCPGGVIGFTQDPQAPSCLPSQMAGCAWANQFKNYTIPAALQPLIRVPNLNDPYKDPSNNLTYPDYTGYFIGVRQGSPNNLPGAMGLRLATALGPDTTTSFDSNLATTIWNNKDAIFAQNVNDLAGTSAVEQQGLDPVDPTGSVEPDPLFSPTIGSGPTNGKTFMLVAADTTHNVVLVYKEVAPFERNVPGAIAFPRVVHGFVFVPPGVTTADMQNLNFQFDLDGVGANLNSAGDFVATDGNAYGTAHSGIVDVSNKMLRKVANALWKAGRGECGVIGPCYTSVLETAWEPSILNAGGTPADIYDGNSNMKAARLVAYGAIETTDTLNLGNFLYGGRFTLYSRNSNGAGAGIGLVRFSDNSYAIPSIRYPAATTPATYVAFPCQNNMGIMTPDDIDHHISPHDDFEGSYFAGGSDDSTKGIIHLTKQEQILGAMVAKGWEFENGGNPDFFQAMEISRCLPPYIIAKDVIVYADSVSWLER